MSKQATDRLLECSSSSVALHNLKLPWELGVMSEIFGNETILPETPKVLSASPVLPLECSSTFEEAELSSTAMRVGVYTQVAVSSRQVGKPLETLGQQMEVLAKRYEVLIGHAYQCSSLGRLIADKAFDKRVELVADAIGGKAVSTLKKRLASLKDLVAFCCGEGLSAWPLDDQVVIEYTAFLIKEGAKVSKLEGALEACNFARFVLGVDVVGEPLKHPVVMGRLRRARLFRAPKGKARAMSVQEIIFLESLLRDASQAPHDRFAAGAYLFAVHSRARMGDLAEVHSFKCDFTEGGGGGYIECVSLSHKSRSYGTFVGLQMFLVAPAQGLGTGFWAHEWVKVWDLSKHPISQAVQMPLLQRPRLFRGLTRLM